MYNTPLDLEQDTEIKILLH